MKLFRFSATAMLLNLILCLALATSALAAANDPASRQSGKRQQDVTAEVVDSQTQASDPTAVSGAENPLTCIETWTGVHLASLALATGLGFTPFKVAAIAADGTAHWADVELKHCDPFLEAPPDIVIEPSGCTGVLEIPITRDLLDQLVLDNQIIEQIVNDADANLPSDFKLELQKTLDNDFGYLANQTSGEYSNIYFIVNPTDSTAIWPTNWGELGVPELYHFNSDLYVTANHTGTRISVNEVEFPAGSHSVRWTADTLISGADLVWVPDLTGLGAASKKAKKVAAKRTWKQTIKAWFKAAKNAAKDAYTDIAKNQAKKTKSKIKKQYKKYKKRKKIEDRVGFVLDSYFLAGYTHDRTTVRFQRIYVIDKNAPQISGNVPVRVEALEPGGVSSGNHIERLKRQLDITDDCATEARVTYSTPSFWPLSLQEDGSSIPSQIQWTASDNGAAGPTGGVNSTSVTQDVEVVDTKPPILVAPPPVIVEATSSDVMTVPLGMPQVFDVADLRPTLSNDAPEEFTQGIYRINWRATDFSGNVSEATKDAVQIVNLKEPGTNILPVAFEQTGADAVSAISYEPITVTVRGQDGDPTPDPLWFSIENQPQNGFFIAPLYPYFIDDYRMTARYSPEIAAVTDEEFALQLATQKGAMGQFMKDLCSQSSSPHPSIPNDPPDELPHDFVSWIGGNEKYMAVDDDGFTYIYDFRYTDCNQNHNPRSTERLSVWDPEGRFYGELDLGEAQIKDINFDLVRGYIIITTVSGTISNSSAHTHVVILKINRENREQPLESILHYAMRNDVLDVNSDRKAQMRAESAVLDSNGVLYAIGRQPNEGMVAAYPDPETEDQLILLDQLIYSDGIKKSVFVESGVKIRFLYDVAVDSNNDIYVSATVETRENNVFFTADRIYKFSAATINPDGSMMSGELIGWLGKCDRGPNCDYINGRSIGYSCTDETCFFDEGQSGKGDRQGQFDGINSIAIDPNDVLYATDRGRVQRFSPEGYVAGEARSTGDGSGFVLGDFGNPDYIAVNRGSFYILDRSREIVHIFDAAVIHGIDESSAWVEYQSENNFVGTDRFTFTASDGFRNSEGETLSSPPATVEVNVTRNFRPPEATAGLAISVTEDTPTPLVLEGYDIDGTLDTLTFQITSSPEDGVLSGTPPNLTYTPRENFDDEDSFFFTVSDGRFNSAPEEFFIDMIPVNDAPALLLETDSLRAGAGFPFTIQGSVHDPEIDDDLSIRIDWGDGTIEDEGTAQNDGTLSGPVINTSGIVTRTLLAYHTYANPGTYNLKITVTDPSGARDEFSTPVVVETMADLALQRRGSTSASPTRLTLSYDLVAVNLSSGSGDETASGVKVSETLGEGLAYRTAATSGGTCTAVDKALNCVLDDLLPDATATVQVVVDVDSGVKVGAEIDARAVVSATTPDPVPENNDSHVQIAILPAADFLVDTPLEGSDLAPGDGLCLTEAGACTLRAAVQEANALPGKQSIALPRDTYMLNVDDAAIAAAFFGTEAAPGEDAAASGDLDVTDNLDLIGLGASETEINANSQDRVVDVLNAATVSIRGVALSGGSPADAESSYGGGLRNVDGNVTLSAVSINANQSLGGGGVANMGGTMRIVASSITGNDAGAGSGGGLLNQADVMLENVTISGNRAASGGGLQALGGMATLHNVTLVSNVAANAGGGINNGDGNAVHLANTIVADNVAEFGPACGFTLRSDGYNLFDNLSDCTVLGDTGTNVIDGEFSMENMSVNGASTYSHIPVTGSRVIDMGRCDLATDQRGIARPQGESCDIGAVETVENEVEPVSPPTVLRNVYLPMVIR